MRLIQSLFLIPLILSCQPKSAQEVTIRAVDRSSLPKEAALALVTPTDELRSGENELRFKVASYELGVPTASSRASELANSPKGQHIHHILDNAPYMARYHERLTLDLDTGNHVLLSFLSRSYHESIKSSDAFVIRQFQVSNKGEANYDLERGKHLFYSRPKGNYIIRAGLSGSILLDFYLLNTNLEDGSYIKAVLNGKTFILKEWKPYFIDGLGLGEHTLSLQLMNQAGKPIEGPFNYSGNRKFTISQTK
ncbi:MAG: hypothetical protein HEP71_17475 [Roseivirga sp.]|nr:hypothetical protein [Roseivirga sp.]